MTISKVVAASDLAAKLIAGVLIVALLTTVLLGVVTRAIGDPLIWTDEVSRFLMVWLAAIGWWLAGRKRAHIRIRFFVDLLPDPARRRAELMIQLAVTLFGLLAAWHGVSLVARFADVSATTVPVSMALLYLPVIVAGLATSLQGAGEVWESLRSRGP
jgi:TRAP-type C4-dicarboxylate transport system permease small subunit